jgi:putative transposase
MCQMPKKRFSDEQIAFALRQAESGTPVGEICRQNGGAEATFYHLVERLVAEVAALRERVCALEAENVLASGRACASQRSQGPPEAEAVRNGGGDEQTEGKGRAEEGETREAPFSGGE